jgi:Putative auto-transporter adhesin, head GIN domain
MALAGLAGLALAGCGAGPMIAQPRPVGESVRSLRISSSIDVRVHRAARPGVIVHAGRDVIDRVVTQTEGDVLRIAVRDRGIVIGSDPLANVSVDVSLPRLEDVFVDGSADVRLDRLRARALTFRVRGTGSLRAEGQVRRLVTDIKGAADARLARLQARNAHVSVQGAGGVDVSVSKRLSVLVRGAADITYRGDPVVTKDISGPGTVRHAP